MKHYIGASNPMREQFNPQASYGSIRKLNYVPESPVMRRRRCRWPRRMPIRGK